MKCTNLSANCYYESGNMCVPALLDWGMGIYIYQTQMNSTPEVVFKLFTIKPFQNVSRPPINSSTSSMDREPPAFRWLWMADSMLHLITVSASVRIHDASVTHQWYLSSKSLNPEIWISDISDMWRVTSVWISLRRCISLKDAQSTCRNVLEASFFLSICLMVSKIDWTEDIVFVVAISACRSGKSGNSIDLGVSPCSRYTSSSREDELVPPGSGGSGIPGIREIIALWVRVSDYVGERKDVTR